MHDLPKGSLIFSDLHEQLIAGKCDERLDILLHSAGKDDPISIMVKFDVNAMFPARPFYCTARGPEVVLTLLENVLVMRAELFTGEKLPGTMYNMVFTTDRGEIINTHVPTIPRPGDEILLTSIVEGGATMYVVKKPLRMFAPEAHFSADPVIAMVEVLTRKDIQEGGKG